MIIAIHTLGCKVNQYETQAIEAELLKRGHTLTDFSADADAYIINTCAVTATADKKSRQAVRHARKTAPGAIVAVCGCCAELNQSDMKKLGADLTGGASERMKFIDQLENYFAGQDFIPSSSDGKYKFELLPPTRESTDFSGKQSGLLLRTRAYLKIQDGCSNFCAYCVIPFARGPARSIPEKDAVAYIRELALSGYRETVITGIEISSYGQDFKTGGLISLLPRLLGAADDMRLRLGSLEPGIITQEFLEHTASFKNLCPHFHLSLQSGCDETLLRMGRKYDTARFFKSCELLREYFPNCSITTDLIVGFPGETEVEFLKTMSFIEKCAFSNMHIFPYSRRKNTKAYDMPCQISNAEKKARAEKARQLALKMEYNYKKTQIARVLSVLFETETEETAQGHSENYLYISAPGTGLKGQIHNVRITELRDDILTGEIIPSRE